jgi:hypothetical protein
VSPPTQQSGAPPPGERFALHDSDRCQAIKPEQDLPPSRRLAADMSTMDSAPSVPRQLRRRRAASWRCEPLPSGQRGGDHGGQRDDAACERDDHRCGEPHRSRANNSQIRRQLVEITTEAMARESGR